MPTDPYPLAILLFDTNDSKRPNDTIWSWPEWQRISGYSLPPYHPRFNTLVPASAAIPEKEHLALMSFIEKFLTTEGPKQNAFVMRNAADADQEGRKFWRNWVTRHWKKWNLLHLVEKTLKARGADPWTIMAEDNSRVLPTQEDANIDSHISAISTDLFGVDALVNPANPNRIKLKARRFTSELVTHLWNAYRKTINREFNRIETERKNLEDAWKALQENPTTAQIRAYLRKMDKLVALLGKYRDTDSLNLLEEQRIQLQGMLAALGLDENGKDLSKRPGLPKPIRDALLYLASTDDIKTLGLEIHEHLLRVQKEPAQVPELNFDHEPPIEWEEGVEEYSTKSMDELWAILGLQKTKTLPDFNNKIDIDAHNYWSNPEYMAENESTLRPLAPRWHQLVGILKIVVQAFKGEPLMLMDQVGVGKTLQLVGAIAVLTFFRDFYDKDKSFPGGFEGMKWQGKDGNIPSNPILLTVPKSLELQFTNELRRYLRPKTFDILPYTGTWEKRQNWWTQVWSSSKHDPSRRIIVAATTAIESDGSRSWTYSNDDPCLPLPTAWLSTGDNKQTTVYGINWLVFGCDEFHFARSINKRYRAILPLVQQSSLSITMTATPITTSIMDIWNLGRVLGIFTSADNSAFNDMKRDINRARAQDRKTRDEDGNPQAGIIVRGILEGQSTPVNMEMQQQTVTSNWMRLIRERFRGKVMRRTGSSKDNNGKFISGIAAPSDHLLLLDLYDWERENLERLAKKMLESPNAGARLGSSENFYIDTRRALLHPSCSTKHHLWVDPKTIEQWKLKPSVKLDALVQILTHHLGQDNALPLQVSTDGHLLEPCQDYQQHPRREALHPDKIVIYSEFPSSNPQITSVLKLHHIDVLEYNGGMTQQQRGKVLEGFRSSGGGRVLLLSNVGATGLNLDIASILVIIDTLWSAQDDSQLCGRVVRYPQPKHVHIYRLIAKNTSDVFLNNNSFGKEAIQQAFLGATPKMQSLFQPNPDDGVDGDSEGEDEANQPQPDQTSKKSKRPPRKSKKSAKAHTSNTPVDVPQADDPGVTPSPDSAPVPQPSLATEASRTSTSTFTATPSTHIQTASGIIGNPGPSRTSIHPATSEPLQITPASALPRVEEDVQASRTSNTTVTSASQSTSSFPHSSESSDSMITDSPTAPSLQPLETSTPVNRNLNLNTSKSLTSESFSSRPLDLMGLDNLKLNDDPNASHSAEDRPHTPTSQTDMDMGWPQIQKSSIGKHLRPTNTTPLSSPSRDRTKRPKANPIDFDNEDEDEQLMGPSRSRQNRPQVSPVPTGSMNHRLYPQQKAERAGFNPSQTPLGKLFSKGNATAESLPVLKRKMDLDAGKGKGKGKGRA